MQPQINLTPTASLISVPSIGSDGNGSHGAGKVITARTWGTPQSCSASALLVHGLGAHSGWFEALARRLKVHSIFVLAYDQLGFGKRRQEKFNSYAEWIDDLNQVFDYQQSLIGEKPLFLLANSMGAAVALKALSLKTIEPSGLVMFSPGVEAHPKTFSLSYRLRTLLTAWINPEQDVTLPYGTDLVTRDLSARQWIASDPDLRLTLPARMLWELLKMTRNMSEQASSVTCPVLMFSAGIDQLVDTKANGRLFEQLSGRSKSHRIFEEAWHDLLFDPIIDQLVAELIVWMRQTAAG